MAVFSTLHQINNSSQQSHIQVSNPTSEEGCGIGHITVIQHNYYEHKELKYKHEVTHRVEVKNCEEMAAGSVCRRGVGR